jgi:hypothetical protein
LFPIFLILTFIKQKITQEILSSTYQKTALKNIPENSRSTTCKIHTKKYFQPDWQKLTNLFLDGRRIENNDLGA